MVAFIMLCLGIVILYVATIWKLSDESKDRQKKKTEENEFKEETEVHNKDTGRKYYD